MTKPRLEMPNENERAWIASNVAFATEMAHKYGAPGSTPLAALDGVWTTLGTAIRESNQDPNNLINVIGCALGQHLVDELRLTWTLATDEYGTELAVHGQPGDVLVFPCNLAAKRWQSGATNWIANIGADLARDIRRLQGA